MTNITKEERDLLQWIWEGEFAQYGECYGKTLDSLLAQGLAQVHSNGEHQTSFIAKGVSQMHQAVSVTDAGRDALAINEA